MVQNSKGGKQAQANNGPVAPESSVSAASKRQSKRDEKKVNALQNTKPDNNKRTTNERAKTPMNQWPKKAEAMEDTVKATVDPMSQGGA